jgi:spermidine/putrescine transport system permease protein
LASRTAWLPAVVLLVLLFALPQVLLVAAPIDVLAASFARLTDPLYLRIAVRSVLLASITTATTLIVGFPVAWVLAQRVPPRFRSAALLLVTLPLWTSVLVKIYAWMFLLRSQGLLARALAAIGVNDPALLYTDAAVAIGQLYIELPFMILPIYSSLERLDPRLIDAARDLGARGATVLRRVILPLVAPGIVAGCVLVFVPSLGAVLAPDLLGGARDPWLGTLIAAQFGAARDPGFGAALAFALAASTLAVFAAFQRSLRAAEAR